MTYAIISDVHANEIALSAVLEDARNCGAQKIICLGDVVGYGPEPEKAVDIVRRATVMSLAGNHDDAVAGRLDSTDFIDLAADAVARHREALSQENLEWLRNRPYTFRGKSFVCTHGDFTSPKSFLYVTDEAEAAANFSARGEQLMFVGHSHIPGIFLTGASGHVYALPPTDFTLEDGKRYIVNPGSVGYPRTDGNTCESTYVIYNDAERTVVFRHIPFTVRSVMQTGRNQKRTRKRVIAAIAATAAIAAGALAWVFAPDERIETVTEIVTNSVKTVEIVTNNVASIAHVDNSVTCDILSADKKVQLHIKLKKNSPAVQLQLAFLNENGETIGDERWSVKKSKKAKVPIPQGTVRAVLSAGHSIGNEPASFETFSLTPIGR